VTGQIAMPDENAVPPGPLRTLLQALHDLRDLAARPSGRELSRLIEKSDYLDATMSHSLVSDVFSGKRLGRGIGVRTLVMVLAERTNPPRDAISEANRIEALWRAADDERAVRKNAGAPSMNIPASRRPEAATPRSQVDASPHVAPPPSAVEPPSEHTEAQRDAEIEQVLESLRVGFTGTRVAATRRLGELAKEGRIGPQDRERAIRILTTYGLKDASGDVRRASDLTLEVLQQST
jgi:hypothetical protein